MENDRECPRGGECDCQGMKWDIRFPLLPDGLAGFVLLVDDKVLSRAAAKTLGIFMQVMAQKWLQSEGVLKIDSKPELKVLSNPL